MLSFAVVSCFIATGQGRSAAILDYINNPPDLFIPERSITGLCFIILDDGFGLYKTPIVINETNGAELLKIEFENSLLKTTYKGKPNDQHDSKHAFNPWLFINNPDYFRIALECTDSSGLFYKVRLNEIDYALINKKDRTFTKQRISDFVITWTSTGVDFNRTTNPLKESPSDESKTILHPEQKKYKIWYAESQDIQGDWIKVKTIKDEVGWIRWTKGHELLIKMYFAW